jgi:hypothetical protein
MGARTMEGTLMNERIKELVKEAGGEFWQRIENDVVNPEAYITFDPPQSLEKFAELIVQEMLQTCEDHPAWTGRMICVQIKEHFGVKE